MPRGKLTKGETGLYWGLWSEYQAFLVADKGWSKPRAAAFRHELARRIFGYEISSTDFTRSHLNRWKAVIKAHTEPDNVAVQLDAQDQPLKRARVALYKLAKENDITTAYLEGMATRICKKPLQQCAATDLPKLIAALRMHLNRQTANNPF